MPSARIIDGCEQLVHEGNNTNKISLHSTQQCDDVVVRPMETSQRSLESPSERVIKKMLIAQQPWTIAE